MARHAGGWGGIPTGGGGGSGSGGLPPLGGSSPSWPLPSSPIPGGPFGPGSNGLLPGLVPAAAGTGGAGEVALEGGLGALCVGSGVCEIAAATAAVGGIGYLIYTAIHQTVPIREVRAVTLNGSLIYSKAKDKKKGGKKAPSKPGARPKDVPTGTKPIDEMGWSSGRIHGIKDGLGAGPQD
jgi:hypothetical protein